MYSQEEEKAFLLQEFGHGMLPYSGKRIALYGTGMNTGHILEYCKHDDRFRVVALLDAAKEGRMLFGLPVISATEALMRVDVIVIVARYAVVSVIYERIRHLEESGIEIVLADGTKYRERPLNHDNPYYKLRYEDLLAAIDSHDAISFDIFDTLVCRRCQYPDDAVELARMTGLTPFEMEKRLLVPRKKMNDALRYAVHAGKAVSLISDMYYNKDMLRELLVHAGVDLEGVREILVSCDVGAEKWPDGALFFHYRKKFPENTKFLHIGDNPAADVSCAEKTGMDAFYIMSTYEMVAQSHFRKLLVNIRTLSDKLVFGLVISEILNDPFSLCADNGRVYFDDAWRMSYATCAPLAVAYNLYLMEKYAGKRKHVIFWGARDGYPIGMLYEKMKGDLNAVDCPMGHYVLMSRLSLSVASISSEDDLRLILKRHKSDIEEKRNILPQYFLTETDECGNDPLVLGSAEVGALVMLHKEMIFDVARRARRNYLEYLAQFASADDEIILFDLQSSATQLFYLGKLISNPLNLEAVLTTEVVGYSLFAACGNHRVSSYFPRSEQYLNSSPFCRLILERNFPESVFISHDGLFLMLNEGSPVFAGKNSFQKSGNLLQRSHSAFFDFWNAYHALTDGMPRHDITPSFIESLFHILSEDCCIVADEIDSVLLRADENRRQRHH